LPETQRSHA